MTRFPIDPRGDPGSGPTTVHRWECHCQHPAVLLGTWDANGRINIKARDRYWHVEGIVRSTCPRCGREHILDPRGRTDSPLPLS